jgi:hypothetical protein
MKLPMLSGAKGTSHENQMDINFHLQNLLVKKRKTFKALGYTNITA